jgi:ribosomal protein L44E
MATLSRTPDMKYCKVCEEYFPKSVWRYHSTQPSMTHIDNAYRNERKRIAGGKA